MYVVYENPYLHIGRFFAFFLTLEEWEYMADWPGETDTSYLVT